MWKLEVTAEEWLVQMKLQPENVARLLEFETRFGRLMRDERGNVWRGGIGPGYGTGFTLMPEPTDAKGEGRDTD